MPSDNRRLIALVVLLGIVLAGAGALLYMRDYYRHESVAMVGHRLPPMVLTDLDEEPVDFGAFHGRPVLATFIQLGCGHCHDQLSVLEKLYKEVADNLAIVVTSTNSHAETTNFFKENPVSFPVWIDSRQGLYKKLGAINVPALFLLDENGILRQAAAGFQSFEDVRKMVIGRPDENNITSGNNLAHPQ